VAAPGIGTTDAATHCNTLQHTAAHYSTLQHTAARCSTLQHAATRCNTLQHAATRCDTLRNTLYHLSSAAGMRVDFSLQLTVAHCNTTRCSTLAAARYNALQHTATRCNTLQHAETHCNTHSIASSPAHAIWRCGRGG